MAEEQTPVCRSCTCRAATDSEFCGCCGAVQRLQRLVCSTRLPAWTDSVVEKQLKATAELYQTLLERDEAEQEEAEDKEDESEDEEEPAPGTNRWHGGKGRHRGGRKHNQSSSSGPYGDSPAGKGKGKGQGKDHSHLAEVIAEAIGRGLSSYDKGKSKGEAKHRGRKGR